MQLVLGQQPNIFHLRTFGCAIYVLITPPQRTKMGHQRRLGIDMGLIPHLSLDITGDVFKAHFENCNFNETIFLPLGGEKLLPEA